MDNETRDFLVQIIDGFLSYTSAQGEEEAACHNLMDLQRLKTEADLNPLSGQRHRDLQKNLEDLFKNGHECRRVAYEKVTSAKRSLHRVKMLIEGKSLEEIDIVFLKEDVKLAKLEQEIKLSFARHGLKT